MSCPDSKSLPVLAEILCLSIEEFMQEKGGKNYTTENPATAPLATILKIVALSMGIAVVVLSILKVLFTNEAIFTTENRPYLHSDFPDAE